MRFNDRGTRAKILKITRKTTDRGNRAKKFWKKYDEIRLVYDCGLLGDRKKISAYENTLRLSGEINRNNLGPRA